MNFMLVMAIAIMVAGIMIMIGKKFLDEILPVVIALIVIWGIFELISTAAKMQ